MRPTFHMAPAEVWSASDPDVPYEAASLATEGFIHCTDGKDELLATANRHYANDPRSFLAVTVDLDACGSAWRIEDTTGIYPHVYGPIERTAILGYAPLVRDATGRFIGFGAPDGEVVSIDESAPGRD
jgi:uncharacterized protein (DUF952 family)